MINSQSDSLQLRVTGLAIQNMSSFRVISKMYGILSSHRFDNEIMAVIDAKIAVAYVGRHLFWMLIVGN